MITPDRLLRIAVHDRGPGISTKDQIELFEPFIRLKRDEASQGTGIRLAVSRLLIELMNGEIGIESEVGKGSSFWIHIRPPDTQVSAS